MSRAQNVVKKSCKLGFCKQSHSLKLQKVGRYVGVTKSFVKNLIDLSVLTNPAKAAQILTLLHSERPKLHTILVFLSAIGLKWQCSLHTCDKFQRGIREAFLSFPGGF